MNSKPANETVQKRKPRDAAGSKKSILTAALREFSEEGFSGARVDRIAKRAGVSKPLIYEYFGDKNAVYAAALREAYIRIRQGENTLDMDAMEPEAAVDALVRFTVRHYRENPWFISMLNTENLHGGSTIKQIDGLSEIQSGLISKLGDVLARGEKAGLFRTGVVPADFYITIASLCYFPISNKHTLEKVFELTIDEEWLTRHTDEISRMVLAYLAKR
ncbi:MULTISPECIES: TetR/AcrR family transcriptional regulator [Halocynthiibacter]|uniref:TetR family transcriptional regulator n=1 Tax=Halocynthiibacter halioticoli TaxID=2986804 RepID=A0AAE3J259_9RHOB|nr:MULTISPECIES: TetR/AcrR family transcriptional regulator [Halocynthiibacter]MCV6824806.1 TetR family transcriptional regulator [Halocynthiibacter halioticoli]MCW4057807.1 TetR family transcriptional regulator [Halocynthiibacter sp. SDUM655004]